eukprot:365490-Chlamydomonas_euryale.AAC.13
MQRPIHKFASTAAQQEGAGKALGWFSYKKNNIALHLIEDPDLQKAFEHVGVLLPDHRELAGGMLDAEHDAVKAVQSQCLGAQSSYALTTDGFEPKYIESGAPLINVIALLSDGGPTFIKVVKAEGVTKDGNGLLNCMLSSSDSWSPVIPGVSQHETVGEGVPTSDTHTVSSTCSEFAEQGRGMPRAQHQGQLDSPGQHMTSIHASIACTHGMHGTHACMHTSMDLSSRTCSIKVAPMPERRGLWSKHLAKTYPLLAKDADSLSSMHATSAASESNWSVWGQIYTKYRNRLSLDKANKIVFMRGNSDILTEPDEEGHEEYSLLTLGNLPCEMYMHGWPLPHSLRI